MSGHPTSTQKKRQPVEYLSAPSHSISIARPGVAAVTIPSTFLHDAIAIAHSVIDQFTDFGVDVFSLLGMRNLSAFIGELYAAAMIKASNHQFVKNPHQDGYPDLLLMDPTGQNLWHSLTTRRREKGPFSPFASGGIEVKATCGAVPTPDQCRKKGFDKPDLGDQRIRCLTGYDWKAHHRDTNNLCGIIWDFIDNIPRITAVFYSHELTVNDWGNIVQPKENGGRTTSVSIMNRLGVKRMYEGWHLVIKDERYIRFIDSYNRSNQLSSALNNRR